MLAPMKYNRKEKQYDVTDTSTGEVSSFPSGTEGKRAATRFAISINHPELAGLAQATVNQYPAAESRIWSAVDLVRTQGITLDPFFEDKATASVRSNHMDGDYRILPNEVGGFICECLDYKEMHAPIGKTGQYLCKHILATIFARKLRTLIGEISV